MTSSMTEPESLRSICLDQRRRWRRCEPIGVEAYLQRQPHLRADPEAVLDLIYNEVVLRQEHGEQPGLAEYVQRFPQLEAELRRQFEVHQVLEDPSCTSFDSSAQPGAAAGGPGGGPAGAEQLPAIPGYTVLGELGRGGMGVVYRARQVGLNRLVAVKMLLGGAHAGAGTIARFRTEAEALAQLQHPHIVQIHEIGEHQGLPYFSLELVGGVGLDSRLAGTPQPATEAARLVETLARAMHYAHQQGILHRDLKPSNVLLQPVSAAGAAAPPARDASPSLPLSCFVPKITDFGLAKLRDLEGNWTPSETFVGTPHYMSPEQAGGQSGPVGPAADVYSLGAILYELLTGQPPFEGQTVLEVLHQVRTQEPLPPSRRQAGVPADLEVICLKCLEKEPGKRYLSAHDLAEDLQHFLADAPIRARPATTWQRLRKWARRRPAATTLAAGSLGLLLALAAALPWYGRITAQAARQRASDYYQRFVQLHDDALFHAQKTHALVQQTLAAGQASADDLRVVEDTARAALSLAGCSTDAASPLALDPHLDDRQRAEMVAGCYTLHLVLAEVAVQAPHPGPAAPEGYHEGLRILARASQLGPPTRAYHQRRAHYLEQLGDRAEARRELEQAQRLPPRTALDYFLIGYECYARGELAQAKAALEQALALEPHHFWAGYYLGLCHLQAQSWEAAKACLTTCAGQRPGFVWPYVLRGIAHARLNELAPALADFARALECQPQQDALYCLHVHRGLMRLQQGQLAEAVDDLQRAVALQPAEYSAYVNLAHVYQRQERHDKALAQLDHAVRLQPPARVLAECQAERARNLYLAGRYDAALEACASALQIRPHYPVVFAFRGLALLELKRYEPARGALDEYLRQGGEPIADIYRGRGLARVKLGDYLGARDDYTRALQLKPDADLYTHRGWAYALAEAWRPAVSDFEEALRLNPHGSEARIGRGLARVMLGSYAPAVEDAEAALQVPPDTPEMMHNIACIYAQAAGRVERQRPQEHEALASRYRQRAGQAIRRALAKLPAEQRESFWREKVSADWALDPIRHSPEFRQLEKDFGSAGPGK
jgi:serine/threonine protein kinase/tetratricopeptide (TPR) repeat protein